MIMPHIITPPQLSAIQIVALVLRALSLLCKSYCVRVFHQVHNIYISIVSASSIIDSNVDDHDENSPLPVAVVPINPMTEFINKENARFSSWVGSSPTIDTDTNIDAVFFDDSATGFRDAVSVRDNEIERKWRTRVLWVMTPRGNVAMFYDAFKEAFAYYADTNAMPYPLLNALAMRYVRTFQCLSFFVDEQSIAELTPVTGRLIAVRKARQRAIDDAEKEAKRGLMWQGSGNAVAAAAAAADWKKKMADASVFRPKLQQPPASTKIVKKLEVVYNYNTFVNVGRMNQYCPLIRQPLKNRSSPSSSSTAIMPLSYFAQNTSPMFESPSIDYYKPSEESSFIKTKDTKTTTMSFADFKRLREQSITD